MVSYKALNTTIKTIIHSFYPTPTDYFFIFVHHNIKDYKSTIYINHIVFEDAKRQLCKQFTTQNMKVRFHIGIVFEDAKRQLCKQFTTVHHPDFPNDLLFLKMLKDTFVSTSQLGTELRRRGQNCF